MVRVNSAYLIKMKDCSNTEPPPLLGRRRNTNKFSSEMPVQMNDVLRVNYRPVERNEIAEGKSIKKAQSGNKTIPSQIDIDRLKRKTHLHLQRKGITHVVSNYFIKILIKISINVKVFVLYLNF